MRFRTNPSVWEQDSEVTKFYSFFLQRRSAGLYIQLLKDFMTPGNFHDCDWCVAKGSDCGTDLGVMLDMLDLIS